MLPRVKKFLPHIRQEILLAAGLVFAAQSPLRAADPIATSPRPQTNAVTHWAFKPPTLIDLPDVAQKTWPRSPIDFFILAKLEHAKLSPSAEADRTTLIRRLKFDLLGLPPAPAEIAEFLADPDPKAYERLVERFLASPHYGERWGRHWLDVAGYADSNGYFNADSDRPLAWKYRDYVIRSINNDKPFDQFIREQIAGDEWAGYQPGGDITPDMIEPLIATHFLRNAPDGTGESDGNALELQVDRYSVIEGTAQLIGSAFLGLTVQCARCHNHKFEPITQEEYYQLQAILRPAYDPENWLKPNERALTVGTRAERERRKQQIEKQDRELKAYQESFEGLAKPFRKLAQEERLQTLPEPDRTELRKALEKQEKERSAPMKQLVEKHAALVQIKEEELLSRFPEMASGYKALQSLIRKEEENKIPPLPQITALTEPAGKPPAHHLLTRGNYTKPGREVEPGVPAILSAGAGSYRPGVGQTSGRRTALANWLTSPGNPMTARLMANRIWQRHFGGGLVATADNFGVTGAKPTHPELLDWLAREFVRSRWSVKALHRLIVHSAAYRQASALREDGFRLDPDNQLLWRYPLRRLEAEAIRDAMLFVGSELDLQMDGPFIPSTQTEEGEQVVNEKEPGAKRRSLYLQQRRTTPVSMLDLFDGAKMNPNCVQRTPSTVALQSLALLNSEFVRARSKAFARRVLAEAGRDQAKRIAVAFQLACGRLPNEAESSSAQEFLKEQSTLYGGKPEAEQAPWTDLCQMLFASSAFLYVE